MTEIWDLESEKTKTKLLGRYNESQGLAITQMLF